MTRGNSIPGRAYRKPIGPPAMGVATADVVSTIEVHDGALPVNNRFGRTWPVEVQAGDRSDDWAKDLGKLKVRNAKGQMVPLSGFVTMREVESPRALDFLDIWPMVELTANPEAGVSLKARQSCARRWRRRFARSWG